MNGVGGGGGAALPAGCGFHNREEINCGFFHLLEGGLRGKGGACAARARWPLGGIFHLCAAAAAVVPHGGVVVTAA